MVRGFALTPRRASLVGENLEEGGGEGERIHKIPEIVGEIRGTH
jgi:hypothetical protein